MDSSREIGYATKSMVLYRLMQTLIPTIPVSKSQLKLIQRQIDASGNLTMIDLISLLGPADQLS